MKKAYQKGFISKGILMGATLFAFTSVQAVEYPLPEQGNDVVGYVYSAKVKRGDNLGDFSKRHGIGFYEMLEANPGVHPHRPKSGTELIVPAQYVLPNVKREGIVINLAELRLYYYPKDRPVVVTFPIGIGREGWQTPVTKTSIIDKKKNPYWRPPESIRQEAAKYDVYFDDVVAPGPDNPLGKRAMRLGLGSYLIHGTNLKYGVGERVSSGCIRLHPEDIEALFAMVPVGTPVNIINEPYKVGLHNGALIMEAHRPLSEYRAEWGRSFEPAKTAINERVGGQFVNIDIGQAKSVASKQRGIPEVIGGQGGDQLVEISLPKKEHNDIIPGWF